MDTAEASVLLDGETRRVAPERSLNWKWSLPRGGSVVVDIPNVMEEDWSDIEEFMRLVVKSLGRIKEERYQKVADEVPTR